ncbi:MAG: hypothetical protein QM727_15975 [Niabella sp.]
MRKSGIYFFRAMLRVFIAASLLAKTGTHFPAQCFRSPVMTATYPALRMRRTRAAAWSRAMHAENVLTPSDLIWPLFVTERQRAWRSRSRSLPGVSRWSVDGSPSAPGKRGRSAFPALPCFPTRQHDRRSEDGREALNPDNLMCRAIKAIKDAVPRWVGVLTDVALDPYTSHGHDGLIDDAGYVLNDATVEVLVEQALVQAEAGADIIAPSDMMDGRVGAIRDALEDARAQ